MWKSEFQVRKGTVDEEKMKDKNQAKLKTSSGNVATFNNVSEIALSLGSVYIYKIR